MEKNKLLKGAGIALIVLGALIGVIALLCFVGGDLFAGIIGSQGGSGGAAVKIVMIIIGIMLLIDAAIYIGAGVVGVKQKSVKSCFTIAVVLLVFSALSAISELFSGLWYMAIIILIVPIIYLVGAIQLKKSVANAANTVNEAPAEQVKSDDVQD